MRILLIILLFVHALLHVPGFIKAFKLASLPQLPHAISRINGVLWAFTAVLFVTTAILCLCYNEWWWALALGTLVVSQYLIVSDWEDAGLGTAVNIVILLITLIGAGEWSFSSDTQSDFRRQLRRSNVEQVPDNRTGTKAIYTFKI